MRRLFALMPLVLGMPAALAAVPIEVHVPTTTQCSKAKPCHVAILSPGYGLLGSEYAFLTSHLNRMGYLVVAIHDSAPGIKLDREAPVSPQIQAMARLASASIAKVIDENAPKHPHYDWRKLLLVGHSLGGDTSAQFAADQPARVSAVISLDSRRVAFPRSAAIPVLTLRASDTTADAGVLPTSEERMRYGTCVVNIMGSQHNAMRDAGSDQLKARITAAVDAFLLPAQRPAYACAPDSRLE